MPYYAKIRDNDWGIVEVEIRTSPNELSGYYSAAKRYDYENQQLAPATVYKNAEPRKRHLTPDEAREWAEWLKVAATTAESLDALITTKADLKRKFKVRVTQKTVAVDFAD